MLKHQQRQKNLLETISRKRLSDRIHSPSVSLHPQLFFAWEDIPEAKKARNYAEEVIKDTEVLVVVGYSFHQFNQPIDSQIFKAARNLKKIYLQMDPKDFKPVSARLKNLLPIGTITEIFTHDDLSQFLIPIEFYN